VTDRAELIVEGRIATLSGTAGFGWVEAIAVTGGRVIAAGSRAQVGVLRRSRTRSLILDPSEVALPGLTDAHLHLAAAALSARQVDLEGDPTLELGLHRIAAAHAALERPDAWLLGQGWQSDRWGGWPTAVDLERVAPGRRVALWAHDHHALWASPAALTAAGVGAGTPDPDGGMIQRGPGGEPTGILHETAARVVAERIPPAEPDELVEAIPRLARDALALGVVAVHDPGGLVPEAGLGAAYAAYERLADAGRLPVRVHASLRPEALESAAEHGLRSGSILGLAPDGRARVGWLKLFADGSLGSRTAALVEPYAAEPEGPLPVGRERGIFVTEPDVLAELAGRAAGLGVVSQVHAIGDAAVRAALDALAPHAGRGPLVPRVEHVQLVDPADLPRFARSGIAASVQPVHLRSDAVQAARLWAERAERWGYPWRSLSHSGALVPFGTDAPVEPLDPWPGVAIAVTRMDASWPAGLGPFGPTERLELARAIRAACLDAALSAGELNRGRLVAGQRADVVVLPAAAMAEPVEPGGPLGTARPSRVLVDGVVAFEA
jgi:predicted amidohydrolase YtcJ